MKEVIERVFNEAHSCWRFRWTGLAVATAVALLGWITVFALPDRYEAKASIFVDTRTALEPALRGLTVGQDVNVQLNYVRQALLSGDQLETIARESGVLPATVTDPREIASILNKFSETMLLDVSSASSNGNNRDNETAGSIYSFAYQDTTRERSLKVVDTVLTKFVEETLGGKRRGSLNAQKFLETQIQTYEQRLREAEGKLAEFKKTNLGLMPTEQGGYFAQLQGEIEQARTVEANLQVAMARRAELERQLRGDAVVGASMATAASGQPGGSDTQQRINETQARLNELLLRFTDKHPDVLAARATLAELNARRTSELESLRRGDAAAVAASGVSSNPVYQNIRVQLNQVEVDIAAMRGQLARHRARTAELRKMADTAPTVEADFAALNRDYEINKATYQALLANRDKSRLGEEADTAGSTRFEVVKSPTADFAPIWPKRPLLLVGVLIGSLVLGAGLTYVLHLLNPVVGSLQSLVSLTDIPVIGVVSAAFPEQLGPRARRQLAGFLGATGGLVVLFALVIVLNWTGFRIGAMAGGGGVP